VSNTVQVLYLSDVTVEIESTQGDGMEVPRILLVDDDEVVRISLAAVMRCADFDVVAASSVNQALGFIGSEKFDVLLSDLHMPGAGDGLTVVSAMRHANPKAVTFIFSGHPEMKAAAAAILLQADETLVKPMAPDVLIKAIQERLERGTNTMHVTRSVADILELDTQATIRDWLLRVELEPEIITVRLSPADRCAHLPNLFRDLVARLRQPLPLGTRALVSPAAASHGTIRREQGYTAAMMVEESRMLQVSIFQTLQNNLRHVDFSLVLVDVMAIADEVDSQLAQAMACYSAEDQAESATLAA
jgi:CheY-like chemotaxis protein